jgi:hypothetical protein
LKKHNFPKSTPGAQSITVGGDTAKNAAIVDAATIEAAKDNDLAVRAVPVLAALRDYVTVCKAEEAAVNKRETFLESLKNRDDLFATAQELGDFFSVRRGRKLTLSNGNTYTSVKVLIKEEVGCSYEYFRDLGKKLGKFKNVLPSEARPTLPPKPQASLPPLTTPINIPAEEVAEEVPPQEESTLSLSISDKVRRVLAYADNFAKYLSPSEKDEFYGDLLDKLQTERQFEVADEVADKVGDKVADEVAEEVQEIEA